MKRLRLRLNRKAIRAFVVCHVEKILFAAVAICFLLFVYRAVGREGFSRSPRDLLKMAQDAEGKIAATKAGSLVIASDYRGEVEKTAGHVDVELYRHPNLWRPLLREPPRKRGVPPLLTVRGLRGAAGRGAVRIAPGAADAAGDAAKAVPAESGTGQSIQGERWIVLTGVVPYLEQVKAYQEAFRDAAGKPGPAAVNFSPMAGIGPADPSNRDMPNYVYYLVQRAEVGGSDQIVEEGDWQLGTIHVGKARISALKAWWGVGTTNVHVAPNATDANDPVLPVYLCWPLGFPVPPVVGRPLDEKTFAHPPEIPVMRRDRRPKARSDDRPAVTVPESDRPPAATPDADEPREDRPPSVPSRDGQEVAPESAAPAVVPIRLFRFVDRSVEPGRRYRYRVRLMLDNPNYGQESRFLELPEFGHSKYIVTDWSGPTDVIEMPRDDRLLVLSVRPSAWAAAEPTAKVAVLKWLNPLGVEASREEDKTYRGQLLNFAGCKWLQKEPAAAPQGDLRMLLPPGPVAGAGAVGPGQKEPIDIDYLTESLILDMRGGHRIDLRGQGRLPSREARLNAPGEVLVLDPEGNLVVHDESGE